MLTCSTEQVTTTDCPMDRLGMRGLESLRDLELLTTVKTITDGAVVEVRGELMVCPDETFEGYRERAVVRRLVGRPGRPVIISQRS